jgi:hypothetical protein
MPKRHLKLVTPAIVNRTVTAKRPPNSELRTREYLTETEVERLMKAATRNRWGHRDSTMVLVAYRHGLSGLRGGGPALGTRSSSGRLTCTSAGSNKAPIRSLATNYAPCDDSNVSRSQNHHSCSRPRAARHLAPHPFAFRGLGTYGN